MAPSAAGEAEDIELLVRARTGDDAAFETFVDRFRAFVYWTSHRIAGAIDAEDCTQDTFIKARYSPYTPQRGLRTWLKVVAVRTAIS